MCEPSLSLCPVQPTITVQAWVPSQHNKGLAGESIFWLDSRGVSGSRKQCSLPFIACPARSQGLIWYCTVMYPMATDHNGTDEGKRPEPQAMLDLMRLLWHCQDERLQAVLRISLKQKTLWFFGGGEGYYSFVCFNKRLQPVRWKQPVIIKEISVIHFRLSSLSYNSLQNSFSLAKYFACDGDQEWMLKEAAAVYSQHLTIRTSHDILKQFAFGPSFLIAVSGHPEICLTSQRIRH